MGVLQNYTLAFIESALKGFLWIQRMLPLFRIFFLYYYHVILCRMGWLWNLADWTPKWSECTVHGPVYRVQSLWKYDVSLLLINQVGLQIITCFPDARGCAIHHVFSSQLPRRSPLTSVSCVCMYWDMYCKHSWMSKPRSLCTGGARKEEAWRRTVAWYFHGLYKCCWWECALWWSRAQQAWCFYWSSTGTWQARLSGWMSSCRGCHRSAGYKLESSGPPTLERKDSRSNSTGVEGARIESQHTDMKKRTRIC